MKRMNEVFKLPLTVPVSTDDHLIDDRCRFVGEMAGRNYAKHAAHAINSVESLAAALDALLASSIRMAGSSEFYQAQDDAQAALANYRGAK